MVTMMPKIRNKNIKIGIIIKMNITVKYTQSDPATHSQGYRLGLYVKNANGMPPEIFVCQKRQPSTTDPSYNDLPDKFISLADPVDLQHYPVGEPDLDSQIPFYRVSSIELVFRSAPEMAEVKQMLDEDIRELVHSLHLMQDNSVTEEKTYG